MQIDLSPAEMEANNGVRFTWNILPQTKETEDKLAIPLTALYTPNRWRENIRVPYKVVTCSAQGCGTALNPFCPINYNNNTWQCIICQNRNNFPINYHGMTEMQTVAEVQPQFQTIEYQMDEVKSSPAFLFCIDLCISQQELNSVVAHIIHAVASLPPDALVGVITFGANIHVYDLHAQFCAKSYTFPGTKITTTEQLSQRLGISFSKTHAAAGKSLSQPGQPPQQQQPQQPPHHANPLHEQHQSHQFSRFLGTVLDSQEVITNILNGLQPDSWTYTTTTRPSRCTGLAMSLALNLLEYIHHNKNARLLMFIGGASVTSLPEELVQKDLQRMGQKYALENKGSTQQQLQDAEKERKERYIATQKTDPNVGQVASSTFGEPLRSHHDITKGDAPFYQNACAFYLDLAAKAAKACHIVDIFACCLDQVGLAEMHPVVTQTGGELVLDDSFDHGTFRGSIKKLFRSWPQYDANGAEIGSSLAFSFGSYLKVLASKEVVINGGLGHCTNLNVPGKNTNMKTPLGAGKTQEWYLGGLTDDTTFGVYFSMNEQNKKTTSSGGQQMAPQSPSAYAQHAYFQFQTLFREPNGSTVMRVTTVAKPMSEESNALRQHFDEQAAVVAMTRLALHKVALDPLQDIRRWLDKQLILLCVRFAHYNHKDPQSFQLPENLSLYPTQMYYLRRSPLINIKNSSPDETVFMRTVALKQSTENTLTIIQPTLMAYSLQNQDPATGEFFGQPVSLDSSQLNPQRILLLDSYFNIVVYYGATIAQWKKQKIWQDPQYAHVEQLCMAPLRDLRDAMELRCPCPRYIECVEGGSQQRFLLVKLNPSTAATVGSGGDAINFTDDITVGTFIQHLKRLVTDNPKPTN